MRNVNIISVPGEASVNFATASQVATATGVTVTSITTGTGGVLTFAANSNLRNGTAVFFTQLGSLTLNGGTTALGPYWLQSTAVSGATTATLSSSYTTATLVNLGGSAAGSPKFSTYQIGLTTSLAQGFANKGIAGPTNLAFDGLYYWMLDNIGQVWSNISPLSDNNAWAYTGNSVPSTSYTTGNGLVYYKATDGTGYLFVFHNSSIDYTKTTSSVSVYWNYQYNPLSGTIGSYNASPSQLLNSGSGYTGSHQAICSLADNSIYYCDINFLGSILPTASSAYDPLNTSTYTWNKQALALPPVDNANCLAELGTNLLVGGQKNLIYPWDRIPIVTTKALYNSFSYPIWLAESVVSQMITVNTNTYVFVGNRGRIYVTNGTQAKLYKKIPDYISGTVEPYYYWGGVCSTKNQIFFSAYATNNAGTPLTTGNNAYGGVWAVDMDTEAFRLTNQLSYGSYAGYATAMIAQLPPVTNQLLTPAGTGFYAGWSSTTPAQVGTTYGLDGTSSTPYTGGQSYVTSDMIPIGTAIQPVTPTQFEYKLSTPLLTGESVELQVASNINDTFTSLGVTNGDGTQLSDIFPNKVQAKQWLLIKAILTAKASSPSYNRIMQIRAKGATEATSSQSAFTIE